MPRPILSKLMVCRYTTRCKANDADRGLRAETVVLLHASFLNLTSWDLLVEVLTPYFRVVRLDFPNQGLSGPETKEPPNGNNNKFNLTERNLQVTKLFVDALQIDKFCLIGTSSGGCVGFHFASQYPTCVQRLILINTAGLPRTPATDPKIATIPSWRGGRICESSPESSIRTALNMNFFSQKAPAWLVDLFYNLGRCVDARTPWTSTIFRRVIRGPSCSKSRHPH